MKLSIIVPHYKEPWEACHTLFDSIEIQQGINFADINVIIVNDGEDCKIDPTPLKKYHFPIFVETKPHGGVSAARNYGLDMADGDYVMFCDIDDAFINLYSINMIFQKMAEGYDAITSCFIEEVKQGDSGTIVRHENCVTFVHGKVFKRQYLIDKNLRFKDDLTIHEDSYFIALALICTENKKQIDTPIYLWKWNNSSVVRTDQKDFVLRTYGHLLKSRIAYIEQLKARKIDKAVGPTVTKAFYDCYYDFQKSSFKKPENKKYIEEAERWVKKFYDLYYPIFRVQTPSEIANISQLARSTAIKNGMVGESQTIAEWLNRIKNIKA